MCALYFFSRFFLVSFFSVSRELFSWLNFNKCNARYYDRGELSSWLARTVHISEILSNCAGDGKKMRQSNYRLIYTFFFLLKSNINQLVWPFFFLQKFDIQSPISLSRSFYLSACTPFAIVRIWRFNRFLGNLKLN